MYFYHNMRVKFQYREVVFLYVHCRQGTPKIAIFILILCIPAVTFRTNDGGKRSSNFFHFSKLTMNRILFSHANMKPIITFHTEVSFFVSFFLNIETLGAFLMSVGRLLYNSTVDVKKLSIKDPVLSFGTCTDKKVIYNVNIVL